MPMFLMPDENDAATRKALQEAFEAVFKIGVRHTPDQVEYARVISFLGITLLLELAEDGSHIDVFHKFIEMLKSDLEVIEEQAPAAILQALEEMKRAKQQRKSVSVKRKVERELSKADEDFEKSNEEFERLVQEALAKALSVPPADTGGTH